MPIGGALLRGALPVGAALTFELQVAGLDPFEVHAKLLRERRLPDGESGFAVEFCEVSKETDSRLARAVTETFKDLGARILGQVRAEMARAGVTDVALVAAELQRLKEEQIRAGVYSADRYTRSGSDTVASIVSAATGETQECIVWSLNLYLGLNRSPRVISRVQAAVETFGTGCGTSAASGGLSALHHEIEQRVARMVGKERALVFSTGYAANLGALSSLPGPKDLLLFDRESHASMIDGARLSGKKWLAFKHNDVEDLEEKLRKYGPLHEKVFVVVESAYSMSGDLAPLREIAALKQKHKFLLYVDEAHSFGFYGEGGRGLCHDLGVTKEVDFVMSSFSKATASLGGFFAADEKYCTLVQSTATPYIFQACLSPADAAAILGSLDEIEANPGLAASLHAKNRRMRDLLVRAGFDLGTSESPVIPVYVPDLEKLYALCNALRTHGVYSVPVVFPAVGVNEGRIRFIVNASHTPEQIETTVRVLAEQARALGVLPGG